MTLTERQQRALAYVAARSTGGPLDRSLRITINFHPDRSAVLTGLARTGEYRSQFETGTSAGGLTAFEGGNRWRWEDRMFGGAYGDAAASDRPRYGALNHRRRSVGAAPRFGSAYLRLREHVLDHATFCFPDSVFEPTDFGTATRFDLLRHAMQWDAVARTDADEASVGGLLDDYVEAQVHGKVTLTEDVDALVLDPAHRGTSVESDAAALGIRVEWHEGRRLSVTELARHPDFRGARVVEIGRRIAREGVLDAHVIGTAAARGDAEMQDLKKVWHLIARFGVPIEPGAAAGPHPV